MAGRKVCHGCDRRLQVATKVCECGFTFCSSKECYQCGKRVPVAKKICDCGYSFKQIVNPGFKEMPIELTSDRLRPRRSIPKHGQFSNRKKCYQCGKRVPVAKKICDCGYSFKQIVNPGFKEMPIELMSDRLRPRRSITMSCQLYDNNNFIYNVSMSKLPKHGQFCNGKIYHKHDDMYDKDLKDAALESIANSIITNSRSKEKRDRKESPNYVCQNSHKKEEQFISDNNITVPREDIKEENTTGDIPIDITPCKRPNISSGKITSSPSGLKDLIRDEVSKAIKKKLHGSTGSTLSPQPGFVCEETNVV